MNSNRLQDRFGIFKFTINRLFSIYINKYMDFHVYIYTIHFNY